MREVYIFDRKELETWIENKEKVTRDEIIEVFRKCGTFLKDDYIIYSDEYEKSSPLEHLVEFLKDKFGKEIMEYFYSIKHQFLPTEVYYKDLKSDKEILDEIQLEKKDLEEKLRELNEKENKIKNKIIFKEICFNISFPFPFYAFAFCFS